MPTGRGRIERRRSHDEANSDSPRADAQSPAEHVSGGGPGARLRALVLRARHVPPVRPLLEYSCGPRRSGHDRELGGTLRGLPKRPAASMDWIYGFSAATVDGRYRLGLDAVTPRRVI